MTRPARPALSFGIGAAVGTAGGLIGLGGAEFRLPALVGVLRFSAREGGGVNLVASFIVLAAAFPFRATRWRWSRSCHICRPSSACWQAPCPPPGWVPAGCAGRPTSLPAG